MVATSVTSLAGCADVASLEADEESSTVSLACGSAMDVTGDELGLLLPRPLGLAARQRISASRALGLAARQRISASRALGLAARNLQHPSRTLDRGRCELQERSRSTREACCTRRMPVPRGFSVSFAGSSGRKSRTSRLQRLQLRVLTTPAHLLAFRNRDLHTLSDILQVPAPFPTTRAHLLRPWTPRLTTRAHLLRPWTPRLTTRAHLLRPWTPRLTTRAHLLRMPAARTSQVIGRSGHGACAGEDHRQGTAGPALLAQVVLSKYRAGSSPAPMRVPSALPFLAPCSNRPPATTDLGLYLRDVILELASGWP